MHVVHLHSTKQWERNRKRSHKPLPLALTHIASCELLESLGHSPIEAMVQIANDLDASLELRRRMNAELAQYVYPKRKAVEVAIDQDPPIVHKVVLEMVRTPEVPPE